MTKPQTPPPCGEYLCELAEIGGTASPSLPHEYCDFGLVSFRFRIIAGPHKGQHFDINLEIDHCDDGMRIEELANAMGVEDHDQIEEDMDVLFGKPVTIVIWRLDIDGPCPVAARWGCLSTKEVDYVPRFEVFPAERPPCGEYAVEIDAADFDGQCLLIEFKILGGQWAIGSGPWAGGRLLLPLQIVSHDERLEELERRKLSRILRAIDLEFLEDSDQLIGKAFCLFVWAYEPWRLHDIASFGCVPLEDGCTVDTADQAAAGRHPKWPTGPQGGPCSA